MMEELHLAFLRKYIVGFICLLITIVVVAQSSASRERGDLEILYPYDETVFPPDIAAPTFRWKAGRGTNDFVITLELGDDGKSETIRTRGIEWRPTEDLWETIKDKSRHKATVFRIRRAMDDGRARTMLGTSITFSTSKDPVDAPIFFRDVPLGAREAVDQLESIVWRLGSVSSTELPLAALKNLPLCGNCHSITPDGKTLAMDVDYANDKGSYIITDIAEETVFEKSKVITWSDYKREDGQRTFGLLSQISPDGRYVVSTVKELVVLRYLPDIENSQLFFPAAGILVVYDRKTKEFFPLPGADDPEYVQTNPTWSPDGKSIVFARAKALKELNAEKVAAFVEGTEVLRFDLYRIPFSNGRGGKAEPIPGASENGSSNYFAKFSPDGKWIVFCRANSFMLNQPDSKLYITPAEGGTAHKMRCNSDIGMNSWHSWSPNGRWLVFSSKRNGPYTQLWLTHIDEQGNDSPPVVLESFTSGERAANIPEFVNMPSDKRFKIQIGRRK